MAGGEGTSPAPDRSDVEPIPFRIRVGVTGHRQLSAGVDWERWAYAGLAAIQTALSPKTPLAWSVVSSLAEGADRLVAKVITAEPGSLLEATLPLPAKEYLADFGSMASKAEFTSLLRHAAVVISAPRFDDRDDAYEWASRAMVSRSDVVIAFWDGEPTRGLGGTGATVDFARRHGRPVVHVHTTGETRVEILPPAVASLSPATAVRRPATLLRPARPDPFRHLRRALRGVEAYNREVLGKDRLASAITQIQADLLSGIEHSPQFGQIWHAMKEWVIPHYAKADLLAVSARRRVNSRLALTYLLPLLAIVTVAVQSQFLPGSPPVLWIEVALLLGALAVVGVDRLPELRYSWVDRIPLIHYVPAPPQQQWVSYRHLAERLRSAFFLAAIEPVVQPEKEAGDAYLEMKDSAPQQIGTDFSPIRGFHESAESWLPRLFAEIWRQRPPTLVAEDDVPAIRAVLAEEWVGGQEKYHARAVWRHQRNDRITTTCLVALFAATTAVAGVHAGSGHLGTAADRTFTMIALVFPALAAVLNAFTNHFEFRRQREASAAMSRKLRHAAEILAKAPSLQVLREDAAAVEEMMISENREWFGLMRLRHLELHV